MFIQRQYIHIGVFPGGGERGAYENKLGGNSPLFLLLKKGVCLGPGAWGEAQLWSWAPMCAGR